MTIHDARSQVNAATRVIERLDQVEADAVILIRRRPELDAKVVDIDGRLADDLRVRARIARLERPAAIVEALGERPPPGPESRAWNLAAAQLDQQQAAFGISAGLGRQAGFFDDSAYTKNHDLVAQLPSPIHEGVRRQPIEIESLGVEL